MGTLTAILPQALAAVKTAQTVAQVVTGRTAGDRQQEAMARLQQQQAQQQANLKKQQIDADATVDAERRQRALKNAVARQRAKFGSQGISISDGGSAEAVLLGLFDETEEERDQRQRLDTLRKNAVDTSVSHMSQRNLLEQTQSTRLAGIEKLLS